MTTIAREYVQRPYRRACSYGVPKSTSFRDLGRPFRGRVAVHANSRTSSGRSVRGARPSRPRVDRFRSSQCLARTPLDSSRRRAHDRAMAPTDHERRRAWVELGLVAGTAALQLLFSGLFGLAGPFAVVASVGWIVYLAYRLREPGRARAWGLRTDTLRAASIANATFIVVGGIAMVAYGWSRGHSAPLGKVAWLVVAYSVWGLIQQLMICALVFGNLSIILGSHVRAQIVTVLPF